MEVAALLVSVYLSVEAKLAAMVLVEAELAAMVSVEARVE